MMPKNQISKCTRESLLKIVETYKNIICSEIYKDVNFEVLCEKSYKKGNIIIKFLNKEYDILFSIIFRMNDIYLEPIEKTLSIIKKKSPEHLNKTIKFLLDHKYDIMSSPKFVIKYLFSSDILSKITYPNRSLQLYSLNYSDYMLNKNEKTYKLEKKILLSSIFSSDLNIKESYHSSKIIKELIEKNNLLKTHETELCNIIFYFDIKYVEDIILKYIERNSDSHLFMNNVSNMQNTEMKIIKFIILNLTISKKNFEIYYEKIVKIIKEYFEKKKYTKILRLLYFNMLLLDDIFFQEKNTSDIISDIKTCEEEKTNLLEYILKRIFENNEIEFPMISLLDNVSFYVLNQIIIEIFKFHYKYQNEIMIILYDEIKNRGLTDYFKGDKYLPICELYVKNNRKFIIGNCPICYDDGKMLKLKCNHEVCLNCIFKITKCYYKCSNNI